ncbi:MAG TPA: hypothetical protein VIM65_17240, partial [Cyclobacteriaceae bacterium]
GGATGSSSSNSININFPSDISTNAVTISVNGVNAQGSGPASTTVINFYKPAAAAGVISGFDAVCQNQNGVVYTIPPIQNSTSVFWNVPTGATIASGQNTNTLTLNFSSTFSGGTLYAVGLAGPCGGGTGSTRVIQSPPLLPEAAAVIQGNKVVCQGDAGVTYTVPSIANATGYTWSLPTGATIASGQNTNIITVNFSASAASGNISVFGTNCIGNGTSSSRALVVSTLPGAAGIITGNATPCLGVGVENYSVPTIQNATGYTWTVPSGATIVSGTNTNSITVSYSLSAAAGNITVTGTNCKGNGAASSLAITYVTSGLGNVGGDRIEPSVDLATGIMSTSIPLFSIQDGDIQVPGVLTYTATGVRVTDDDGWVGHNWSFSAQNYQIGREVRGLPDDYSATAPDNRKGRLNSTISTTINNFSPTTDNDPATCSDEVANYNTLNSIDYNQDTEPDAFYVNAPNLSFQFYFDDAKVPRALPYQDVVITPNTVSGPITSFTVKAANGVLYTFAEQETMTQSLNNINNYYLVRQTNLFKSPITYTTAWRLTSMTSPVYGTVTFTYKSVVVGDPNLIPRVFRYDYHYAYNFPIDLTNITCPSSGYTYIKTTMYYTRQSTIKILQKISSPSSEAVFNSAPKYAGALMERLGSISIYDKRDGASKLSNTISFVYTITGTAKRAFLTTLSRSASCFSQNYGMEYDAGELPAYDWSGKDDWDFNKGYSSQLPTPLIPYSQGVQAGILKKLTYPYKGFDVFFYEPHEYWDGTNYVQGAGLRLKKMISYDGVSSNSDVVKEYEYRRTDGYSSGKLQYKALHNFNITRAERLSPNGIGAANSVNNAHYRDWSVGYCFTLQSSVELSHYTPFHGSAVAYERVTVKEKDAGQSIYEFDLPASFGDVSANDPLGNLEWKPSTVLIARPSTGAAACYELANIQGGIAQYPFPPDPAYDFARATLKKLTNLKEDGATTVRDVVYTYQRVYGNNTGIRKINGLAMEELPTYYYNGSTYQDAKMFLYSKYEIFTDVKTELSTQTETIYNSTDLSKKTVTTTSYFFTSSNHKELTRVETQNSDGSVSQTLFTYVKDYAITAPSGTSSTALANLNTAHRNFVVESISKKIIGVTNYFIGAKLFLFQTLSGIVYPDKELSFVSADGITTFTPSSATSSTFQYDLNNYVVDRSYLSFDSYGNPTDVMGRDRQVNSVAYGYGGTLPVITIKDARVSELLYSDFETTTPASFYINWASPTYAVGRNNSKSLNMPVGSASANYLLKTTSITNNNTKNYILSFWAKATTAGNLSIQVFGQTSPTFSYPFTTSSGYTFYSFKVPVSSVPGTNGSFTIKLWSTVAVPVDDIAFYPEQADFTACTYLIPNGKNSETDSHGISRYYDYDLWGRLKVVYDQNKNVIKKNDYQVRP